MFDWSNSGNISNPPLPGELSIRETGSRQRKRGDRVGLDFKPASEVVTPHEQLTPPDTVQYGRFLIMVTMYGEGPRETAQRLEN